MILSKINAAARTLRKEHPSLSWQEAVTWAGQCWREAGERAERERQVFFEARRAAIKAERWLRQVRTAKVLPEDSWGITEREGGRFAGQSWEYQRKAGRVA